jgi:hypothetical protein
MMSSVQDARWELLVTITISFRASLDIPGHKVRLLGPETCLTTMSHHLTGLLIALVPGWRECIQ